MLEYTCILYLYILCFADDLPYECDFEFDLCGMNSTRQDDFDWLFESGPTPTDNTGPDRAQNGTYYMYIESSLQAEGNKAR